MLSLSSNCGFKLPALTLDHGFDNIPHPGIVPLLIDHLITKTTGHFFDCTRNYLSIASVRFLLETE